jgi:hypothetical protein
MESAKLYAPQKSLRCSPSAELHLSRAGSRPAIVVRDVAVLCLSAPLGDARKVTAAVWIASSASLASIWPTHRAPAA